MKTKTKLLITSIIAVSLVILLFLANFLCYQFMHYFMLYDYIMYDGDIYCLTESNPKSNVDFNEKVTVHLVDKKLNAYEKINEYAHPYIGDTENEYLYFDSAVWKKSASIASPSYTDNK